MRLGIRIPGTYPERAARPCPRDHEETSAAITVSDRTLEALHSVANTPVRHDRRIMRSALIAVSIPRLTCLNAPCWNAGRRRLAACLPRSSVENALAACSFARREGSRFFGMPGLWD